MIFQTQEILENKEIYVPMKIHLTVDTGLALTLIRLEKLAT